MTTPMQQVLALAIVFGAAAYLARLGWTRWRAWRAAGSGPADRCGTGCNCG